MADSNLILLLQLLARNADVEHLIRRGLRYSQISRLLSKAIDQKLIRQGDDRLEITDSGSAYLKTATKKGLFRPGSIWISPEEESRIEQQPIDKIYLPKFSKSFFKVREAD